MYGMHITVHTHQMHSPSHNFTLPPKSIPPKLHASPK
jgi:hypothetical protein